MNPSCEQPHPHIGRDPVDSEFSFVDITQLLLRSWRLITAVACVVTVSALVIVWLLPNQYTATVRMAIEPAQTVRMAIEPVQTVHVAVEGADIYSKMVERFQLKKFWHLDSAQQALERLLGCSSLTFDRRDNVLVFQVTLTDAKLAAELANALPGYISDLLMSLAITPLGQKQKAIAMQLNDGYAALAALENRLKSLHTKFSSEQIFNIRLIGDLRAEIAFAALTANDPQNLRLPLALPPELINSLNQPISRTPSTTQTQLIANIDDQKLMQEVVFQRSLNAKLERQLRLIKEQRKDEVRVVASAQPPLTASKPKRAQIVTLSFLGSLMAMLLLVFIRENWRTAAANKKAR